MAASTDLSGVANDICVSNSLQMVERVGEGSFKETFRVINSGETMALKVYKSGSGNERNEREIDAMRRCNHPNIAKLFAIGSHRADNQAYLFVLEEFLGGGTLTRRIENSGLLTREKLIFLGRQLIGAVAHIQQLDLVHRDLKPDNILFREDSDEAVITDFGIVRDLKRESITQSWFLRGPGTYFFSPPEQLNNEKHLIDWRTDQFSLGILLAICIFGEHPYGNQNDVVDLVASRGKPSAHFNDLIIEKRLPVLKKMVEPWSANRYRNPIELQEAWESQGG
jgi:serine/threonine protein kinase